MKKIRESNIELLRIISIFLIIVFHYVYKGGFSFDENFSINKLIVKTFWMFGELGVNLFMLISAYFMINSNFKFKKLITLVMQVLFYHIITIFFVISIGIFEISEWKDIFLILFPITTNYYWFVTAYIIIYILSPYLNILVKAMTKATFKKFLIILLLLYSVMPTFFGSIYNSTETLLYYNRLIWLIVVYFIGAYIRLYSMLIIKNMKKAITISSISFLVLIMSILVIEKFENFFSLIGIKEVAYLWTPNNIPMVLLSIGIFGIFIHLKIPNNKFINKIASTTLGVYLLHDGILSQWLWKIVFKNATYQNSPLLFSHILVSGIIVLIVGIIVDLLRQLIEKYTLNKILESESVNNIFINIKKKVNKVLRIDETYKIKKVRMEVMK